MDPKEINTDALLQLANKIEEAQLASEAIRRRLTAEIELLKLERHHNMKLALANARTSGRLAEREACAQLCEKLWREYHPDDIKAITCGAAFAADLRTLRGRYNTGE
jgi:hypothetical protein